MGPDLTSWVRRLADRAERHRRRQDLADEARVAAALAAHPDLDGPGLIAAAGLPPDPVQAARARMWSDGAVGFRWDYASGAPRRRWQLPGRAAPGGGGPAGGQP
jgi:hypothetical protein